MSNQEIPSDLIRFVYASRATVEFTNDDLVDLLSKAKSNNSKHDITGMLLYDSSSFFQILEGKPQEIETLFKKISIDPRHEDVIKIISEPIENRDFSDWKMGHARVSREDLREIPGLSDFFSSNRVFSELGEGRARNLLNAFKEGQWRRSIN